MRTRFGIAHRAVLTGAIAALVYAYLVRFLAVALQTVEAGLAQDHAEHGGCGAQPRRGAGADAGARARADAGAASLLTAALLVFVDVMKELPATFVMRPFNFDTLAIAGLQPRHRRAAGRSRRRGARIVIVAVGRCDSRGSLDRVARPASS